MWLSSSLIQENWTFEYLQRLWLKLFRSLWKVGGFFEWLRVEFDDLAKFKFENAYKWMLTSKLIFIQAQPMINEQITWYLYKFNLSVMAKLFDIVKKQLDVYELVIWYSFTNDMILMLNEFDTDWQRILRSLANNLIFIVKQSNIRSEEIWSSRSPTVQTNWEFDIQR